MLTKVSQINSLVSSVGNIKFIHFVLKPQAMQCKRYTKPNTRQFDKRPSGAVNFIHVENPPHQNNHNPN